MRLITYQRWWGFLAVTTIALIILWVYILTPINKLYAYPPIPSHSNSRLLPFKYWDHRSSYPELYTDLSSTRLPGISDIQYAANTWQLLQVENGSVYVYGAYWDTRFEEPLVRIIVYSDVLPLPKLYCQMWFPGDNAPQVEQAEALFAWKMRWGGIKDDVNEPYILSCRVRRYEPEPNQAPAAVSVVTSPCDAANNILNVQGSPFDETKVNETRSFNNISIGVCVKGIHFRYDISFILVEWLQILKHFGAEKVFLYAVKLHPQSQRILEYYEKLGFVVLTEVSYPPQLSGVDFDDVMTILSGYKRELLSLNDCLYRNLGRYDWLAVFDVDELIVPVRDNTWQQLIEREVSSAPADQLPLDSLSFYNFYLLDEMQKDYLAPHYARLLGHTWRAKTPSPEGYSMKSFFNTSSVTAMHNHGPMWCRRDCNRRNVKVDVARMMHFRHHRPDHNKGLTDLVRDDIMSKWRKEVLQEINGVLKELDLLT